MILTEEASMIKLSRQAFGPQTTLKLHSIPYIWLKKGVDKNNTN